MIGKLFSQKVGHEKNPKNMIKVGKDYINGKKIEVQRWYEKARNGTKIREKEWRRSKKTNRHNREWMKRENKTKYGKKYKTRRPRNVRRSGRRNKIYKESDKDSAYPTLSAIKQTDRSSVDCYLCAKNMNRR